MDHFHPRVEIWQDMGIFKAINILTYIWKTLLTGDFDQNLTQNTYPSSLIIFTNNFKGAAV